MANVNDDLFVQGNITASGNVNAGVDVTAIHDVVANNDIEAGHIISASVDIGAGHDIVAQHDVTAGNDVNAFSQVRPLTVPTVPTGTTTAVPITQIVSTAQFEPGITVLGTDGNRYTIVLSVADPATPILYFVLQP